MLEKKYWALLVDRTVKAGYELKLVVYKYKESSWIEIILDFKKKHGGGGQISRRWMRSRKPGIIYLSFRNRVLR